MTQPPVGAPVDPRAPYGWVPAAPRRPGAVTAAAIIGIVEAALVAVVALFVIFIGWLVDGVNQTVDHTSTHYSGTFAAAVAPLAVISLVVLAASIRVLAARVWAVATLAVGQLLIIGFDLAGLASGRPGSGVSGLVVGCVVLLLLGLPGSRRWFRELRAVRAQAAVR